MSFEAPAKSFANSARTLPWSCETDPQTRTLYFVDGPEIIPYYFHKAKEQKAVLVGLTGINSASVLDHHEMKRLSEEGISVIWTPLPFPVIRKKINDQAKQRVLSFLTAETSPVQTLFREGVPLLAGAHSTSARIYLDLLHDDKTRERLKTVLPMGILLSPYLETASKPSMLAPLMEKFNGLAAMLDDPISLPSTIRTMLNEWAFAGYAALNRHTPYDKTMMGRRHVRNANYDSIDKTGRAVLTYDHISELEKGGRSTLRNLDPEKLKGLSLTFIVGEKDKYACPLTSRLVARISGSTIISVKDGGHYPFKNHPELIEEVLRSMKQEIAIQQEKKDTTSYITSDEFFRKTKGPTDIEWTEEDEVPYVPTLRDRTRQAMTLFSRLTHPVPVQA